LKNKNPSFLEAVKRGIVLFGPENFVKSLKRLRKND